MKTVVIVSTQPKQCIRAKEEKEEDKAQYRHLPTMVKKNSQSLLSLWNQVSEKKKV